MKVLIGLGNPGFQYQKNRHNVGHMFIDYLRTKNLELRTMKTDCFMNVSGAFVKKNVPSSKFQALYVVHDDLDIPFGKFKIQFGTGPKLHNGIRSVEDELGTNEFWRIRIGVDARSPEKWTDGETYSLEDFTDEQHQQLQSIFENIYKQLTQ